MAPVVTTGLVGNYGAKLEELHAVPRRQPPQGKAQCMNPAAPVAVVLLVVVCVAA